MGKRAREDGTGLFIHTAEAMCVCGHSVGLHTAAKVQGKRECLAGDFDHGICDCVSFRKRRAS